MKENKVVKQAITFLFRKNIMKRRRPLSQAIIFTVALYLPILYFLFFYTAYAQQSDPQIPAFFAKEILLLKEQILIHERNETEALQALEQARKALDLAIKKNNIEAQGIAREAVALAEETLSDVHKQKSSNLARLKAIEGSLRWKKGGTDFGVAGIVKGEVFKKTKSGMAPFDGKSPVIAGDIIETGKNGFLEITLPDYSYISMGANTSLEVSDLNGDRKQSLYNIIRREVLLGKLYIQRKCYLYSRDECWISRYSVTPKVSIGVRGTEFSIEQNQDGSTTLIVLKGTVEVTEEDTRRLTKASDMEQLLIRKDDSVQGPMPVKADSIKRWWED